MIDSIFDFVSVDNCLCIVILIHIATVRNVYVCVCVCLPVLNDCGCCFVVACYL